MTSIVTASRLIGLDDVRALRSAAMQFGGVNRVRKARLLRDCATRAIADPDVLIAWHDCLLFLLAYPESRALHDAARAALSRAAATARTIASDGPPRARKRLNGSGIAWTELTVNFGWDIARWLVARFPRNAEIDSFGDGGTPLPRILSNVLPPIESELLAATDDSKAFLDEASAAHRGSRLSWLVDHFQRLPCADTLRELLFDAVEPYISVSSEDSMLSRTFARGLSGQIFFHRRGLVRDVNLQQILRDEVPEERRLSARERLHIVDVGRAVLTALGRETDAISLSYARGVAWHDLGRGVAIALYPMRADRREALDSHIGMMLFKNGLPVGYGGGWPFLSTCRIGVNVFTPYRGGESTYLFAQVLRVYRQRFGIRRFVAEPSQFGGHNVEGLRSGAFWFYYRLGFRPVEPRAAALAHDEYTRMQADATYRTPIRVLRRFTRDDIERVDDDGVGTSAAAQCDPAELSLAATRWIDTRFHGDRYAAESFAARTVARTLGAKNVERWQESERRAFCSLALLFVQIADLARWPVSDRSALVRVARAKGGDEFRFHRRLQSFPRLRDALEALAARQARGE
jgi:hypothetical protein